MKPYIWVVSKDLLLYSRIQWAESHKLGGGCHGIELVLVISWDFLTIGKIPTPALSFHTHCKCLFSLVNLTVYFVRVLLSVLFCLCGSVAIFIAPRLCGLEMYCIYTVNVAFGVWVEGWQSVLDTIRHVFLLKWTICKWSQSDGSEILKGLGVNVHYIRRWLVDFKQSELWRKV